MAFCTKCGATLEPNAQFCASCGAPVDSNQSPSPSSGSQPPTSSPPTWSSPSSTPAYNQQSPSAMGRPLGVTILAVLAVLAGLAELGYGILYGSVFEIIFALILFGAAYGFWVGTTWGWWLGVIAAILSILSIIFLNVITFIIGIAILYYLTRPHIRMWFRKA
jgi:hypothetical protein